MNVVCNLIFYCKNDLLYCIKIWTDFSSILSQSTRLTDGQTDRQTDNFLVTRPPCIQCSAVKTHKQQKQCKATKVVWPNCQMQLHSISIYSVRAKSANIWHNTAGQSNFFIRNFNLRLAVNTFISDMPNQSRHPVSASSEVVLTTFIKKLYTVNSGDLSWVLLTGQASRAYN